MENSHLSIPIRLLKLRLKYNHRFGIFPIQIIQIGSQKEDVKITYHFPPTYAFWRNLIFCLGVISPISGICFNNLHNNRSTASSLEIGIDFGSIYQIFVLLCRLAFTYSFYRSYQDKTEYAHLVNFLLYPNGRMERKFAKWNPRKNRKFSFFAIIFVGYTFLFGIIFGIAVPVLAAYFPSYSHPVLFHLISISYGNSFAEGCVLQFSSLLVFMLELVLSIPLTMVGLVHTDICLLAMYLLHINIGKLK